MELLLRGSLYSLSLLSLSCREAVPEEPTRDAVIEGLSVQLGSSKERIPLTITYWRPAAMRFRLPVDRKTHVIIVTFDLCNKVSRYNSLRDPFYTLSSSCLYMTDTTHTDQ